MSRDTLIIVALVLAVWWFSSSPAMQTAGSGTYVPPAQPPSTPNNWTRPCPPGTLRQCSTQGTSSTTGNWQLDAWTCGCV